jgi:hypothetical protein
MAPGVEFAYNIILDVYYDKETTHTKFYIILSFGDWKKLNTGMKSKSRGICGIACDIIKQTMSMVIFSI